ncbi:hypothetical protein D915_008365 [Fasciola hepatica]|uniref:Uncharacterized protein n=1 Tax=Fasciola hepatica TaxID=6192 RepID=A0A4E0QZ10_FASHE|nr:hypothetical protein D915_008365 [Fasciola hepatica]
MDEKLASVFTLRTVKIVSAVTVGYFLLPRLRNMILFRLQPFLMHRFHETVRDIKDPVFQLLDEYYQSDTNKSIQILEIGAADGLNLPSLPPGSQVVAVEPLGNFRTRFERRLSEVNASRNGSQPKIKLQAWYSVTAEELQQFIKPRSSHERTLSPFGDLPIGHFDAALSTFTLCTVYDVEQVLRVFTQLVKPVSPDQPQYFQSQYDPRAGYLT